MSTAHIPDEVIIKVRACYEFGGMKQKKLAAKFNLDLESVRRIVRGFTGAKLFVSVKDLPDDVPPLPEFGGAK